MMMNLSMMLFNSTLFLGTAISISSTSWIMVWIGLEMNLLSFIPMMNKNMTSYESEASMKYFLVQAMASIILLVSVLLNYSSETLILGAQITLMTALLTKMGAAPFHLWFPGVMQGLNWINCTILMTWQKIAPMMLVSYQNTNPMIMWLIITANVVVGSIGGLNQTSIRKMLAYSSISHLGWMLLALMMSNEFWILYFVMYTMINVAVIIELHKHMVYHLAPIFNMKPKGMVKFTVLMSILSLGGLPPFLGFVPKWIIIQNMIMTKGFFIMTIMVMTTLITLFFNLRMVYSAFTFHNQNSYWKNEISNKVVITASTVISLTGMPIITYMIT